MGEERCTYDIGSSISSDGTAPLLFFYVQLHKAIRRELSGLSESVVSLETGYAKMGKTKAEELLLHLKKRYRFLEQVYKYHSSIEDEVGIFLVVWFLLRPVELNLERPKSVVESSSLGLQCDDCLGKDENGYF